jgi:predicted phosphodiesterase
MAKLQILSDLHLEAPAAYDVFEISPLAPYLALLGDIGYTKDDGFLEFIRRQLFQFEIVFFVPGNHEPYHSSLAASKVRLLEFQAKTELDQTTGKSYGKFVLLDQTRYDLSPSVTILGCTLFSRITDEQKDFVSFGMNDFYHIQDWTLEDHTQQQASDLRWLNSEVHKIAEEPQRHIIILTHYSPTVDTRAVDPKHMNSNISSGFMSDLSGEICFSSKQVAIWAFGHTHFNCDFEHETTRTRLVTNQRGYYFSQADGFNLGKVVEI